MTSLTSPIVDADTVQYMIETRKLFEDLRQVAAQLAGLLILAASGARSACADHPLVGEAGCLLAETTETIERTRPPIRARRHYHHLQRGSALLRKSLESAYQLGVGRRVDDGHIDPILVPLRAAHAHLQSASNELPGFPMVAFEQGCCGRAPQSVNVTPDR